MTAAADSDPTNASHASADDISYSRPPKRIPRDWSAHIATTLERLAAVLAEFDEAQWSAPSLCEGWTVRDVTGHIVWRVGESGGGMFRSGFTAMKRAGFKPTNVLDVTAHEEAKANPATLVARLREIATEKLQGHGRTGVIELTETVVHTYDITEALGVEIRLSPRSTSAVALASLKSPVAGKHARIAKDRLLRATDARWVIGRGQPLDATAGEILMHLFGRRSLLA